MTAKRKFRIGISLAGGTVVGVVVIVALLHFLIGPRGILGGFDRGMDARYGKIMVGESKKSVVDALGEPLNKTDGFNLPQRLGFEDLFDAAEKSTAREYYQWMNGTNWYYCIGFDPDGIVVIKGGGHS